MCLASNFRRGEASYHLEGAISHIYYTAYFETVADIISHISLLTLYRPLSSLKRPLEARECSVGAGCSAET